jgi:hypothetical protein
MTNQTSVPPSSVATSSGFAAFIFGHCIVAQKRAEMVANEIAFIATALRTGLVTGEQACLHLHEVGLLGFVTARSSS